MNEAIVRVDGQLQINPNPRITEKVFRQDQKYLDEGYRGMYALYVHQLRILVHLV